MAWTLIWPFLAYPDAVGVLPIKPTFVNSCASQIETGMLNYKLSNFKKVIAVSCNNDTFLILRNSGNVNVQKKIVNFKSDVLMLGNEPFDF